MIATLAFTGCRSPQDSESKALPFVCRGENASSIYFDPDHAQILAGHLKGASIESMLVFGDSLSDSGRLGRKSKDLLVPKCKYWNNRFSNGPVWNEYLSVAAGWNLYNYAVGGSGTSKEVGGGFLGWLHYLNPFTIKSSFQDVVLTPLLDQIEDYARDQSSGKTTLDPSETLVSIWAGPNNYFVHGRDVEDKEGHLIQVKAEDLVDRTISDLHQSVLRLKALGFTRITMGTMPGLVGIQPDPSNLIQLASDETLGFLGRRHNQSLEAMVAKFRSEGLDIVVFHSNEINKATNSSLGTYGFDSIKPCYEGDILGFVPKGKLNFCEHPLRQKLWDNLHPNTRMHCIYASQYANDAKAAGWLEITEDFLQTCINMRTKSGIE